MQLRTKTFIATFGVAAISLLLAASLISWSLKARVDERIERNLLGNAKLVAQLLSQGVEEMDPVELDDEVDALGTLLGARITLIGPNGRVVGDSDENVLEEIAYPEIRSEIEATRRDGYAITTRPSTVVDTEILYAVVPVRHRLISYVRLALPRAEFDQDTKTVRRLTLVALLIAVMSALGLAWVTSLWLKRRVQTATKSVERYALGDWSRPIRDYGRDEIGNLVRVFDGTIQELGRRMDQSSREKILMSALLSGMAEGLLVINPIGRLEIANEAACRILKFNETDVGRPYVELFRDPVVTAQITSALAGLTPDSVEVVLNHDQRRAFVALTSPVGVSGGNSAVLILREITELRRAETIRQDFMANVSHELRTPLTVIRGAVEALADIIPTGAPDQQRFFEIIARHTERMTRLVNDLLRLARLDARQEILDTKLCSTDAVLVGVWADLVTAIESKRLSFEKEIEARASMIVVDPTKLHDVLRNLLENAVNYAPEGSVIRFESFLEDKNIVMRISDSGPGIPETDLPRVFERFYRVDRARTRDLGGTGLGLAIVKHLVGLHGGAVRAANRPEGGAIFTISLPKAADQDLGAAVTKSVR